MKHKLVFIVGPTAMGKSLIAVHLAQKINAEIISCDSMQVYKRMDIITSKPPRQITRKVKHHLIDIISPTKEYNVACYRKDAIKKIKAIFNRGRMPIFVGGTGLYISILIDGIFRQKPQNKSIRNQLYQELKEKGSSFLYERLKKNDLAAAFKIHPNDVRRIVRALEVFESTGKPISQLQRQRKGLSDKYEINIFGLNIERPALYKRIDERVDKMFRQGLIGEVKMLLKLRLSKTACCAIGIKELKGYFEGLCDLGQAIRLIKHNSHKYAKRQLTWFRKDKRIEWLEIKDKESCASIADRIFRQLN